TIGTVAAGGNCGFTGATGLVSNDNDINLNAGTRHATNAPNNAGTGDVRLRSEERRQGAAGVLTGDELGITAGGAVTLCVATNDVNTLSINTTGLIEFRDGDDLTIGTVAAGVGCGFAGASGLVSNDNDINLNAGTSLAINAPINAGTGDVRLVAGTTVTQATGGTITADELGITAGGSGTLCAAPKVGNTPAVNTIGSYAFRVDVVPP